MKTNLISSIASWKSAALLGLVALIATVAFSGVLSTTQTAEAQSLSGDTTVSPGATITVTYDGGNNFADGEYATFVIATSGTAKASFVVGGGQSLLCKDSAAAIGPANPCDNDSSGNIGVKVKIADDSPDGPLVITATALDGSPAGASVKVITVSSALTPTALTVKAAKPSVPVGDASGSEITITVTNSAGTGVGSQALTVTTTRGLFQAGGCTGASSDVQTCSVTTTATGDDIGKAVVTLTGAGSDPGVATITATHTTVSSVTGTAKVVLSGAASKISASAQQSAVKVGDSTYVVVTITDAGGNPIAGHTIATTLVTVTGPNAKAVKVATAVNSDYNVDNNAAKSLPACDEDNTQLDIAGDGSADEELFDTEGTNAKGQCVVKVTATDNVAPAPDATRGAHTITVKVDATATAKSAEAIVSVGGAPTSMTDDAPERVADLDEITIKVNVWDDADVPVGSVAFSATKVAGDGLLVGVPATTTDGAASFKYVAGIGGTAVIRLTAGSGAGQIVDSITIHVGAAPVAMTWSADLVTGWNAVTWMGEDGASLADNSEGVNSIYQWNPANQSWDAWFPGTDGVPGANDISSLENGAVYWVNSQ